MSDTTLCYIEKDGCYLMLYRNKKAVDNNAGKWIGVGGGLEKYETPLQGIKREVWEETGLTPENFRYRGVIKFISDIYEKEQMHLFTACTNATPNMNCNEGTLQWVKKEEVLKLNLWEGDRIFLKLLAEDAPFFKLELVYEGDKLVNSTLEY